MAVAVEEHGLEIVEVYLQAMRGGDWRSAEALMSRIYGKPTETVVTHTPVSPEKAVLSSMTLEEKLELLRRPQDGEFVSTASALPVVEPAPAHERPHLPARAFTGAGGHHRRAEWRPFGAPLWGRPFGAPLWRPQNGLSKGKTGGSGGGTVSFGHHADPRWLGLGGHARRIGVRTPLYSGSQCATTAPLAKLIGSPLA
jgi:hypothetical protein